MTKSEKFKSERKWWNALRRTKVASCGPNNSKINMSTGEIEKFIKCNRSERFRIIYDVPMIVVNYEHRTQLFKTAYDDKPQFWTRHLNRLQDMKTLVSWLFLHNYFSKLMLPTFLTWSESGLANYWENKQLEDYQLSRLSRTYVPALYKEKPVGKIDDAPPMPLSLI